MAKTDQDGRFEIDKLPVGRHTFRLWHESSGYLKHVSVGGRKSDKAGRITIEVKEGTNELGETKLPSKLFRH